MFHVEQSQRLEQSLNILGITLDEPLRHQMLKFLEILLRENEKINLTAIKTLDDGISKHLVDSLSILTLDLGASQQWLDLGSGGGMPGMILALAKPEISMTLVESTQKKAHFLNLAAAELGLLKRVQIEPERAERLGQGKLREKFDIVTCRALGRLNIVLELAIPLLKIGGKLIAYKGPKADEEILEAEKALKLLNAKVSQKKTFTLPFLEETRTLIVIEKLALTPRQYPRLPGTPAKEPIV